MKQLMIALLCALLAAPQSLVAGSPAPEERIVTPLVLADRTASQAITGASTSLALPDIKRYLEGTTPSGKARFQLLVPDTTPDWALEEIATVLDPALPPQTELIFARFSMATYEHHLEQYGEFLDELAHGENAQTQLKLAGEDLELPPDLVAKWPEIKEALLAQAKAEQELLKNRSQIEKLRAFVANIGTRLGSAVIRGSIELSIWAAIGLGFALSGQDVGISDIITKPTLLKEYSWALVPLSVQIMTVLSPIKDFLSTFYWTNITDWLQIFPARRKFQNVITFMTKPRNFGIYDMLAKSKSRYGRLLARVTKPVMNVLSRAVEKIAAPVTGVKLEMLQLAAPMLLWFIGNAMVQFTVIDFAQPPGKRAEMFGSRVYPYLLQMFAILPLTMIVDNVISTLGYRGGKALEEAKQMSAQLRQFQIQLSMVVSTLAGTALSFMGVNFWGSLGAVIGMTAISWTSLLTMYFRARNRGLLTDVEGGLEDEDIIKQLRLELKRQGGDLTDEKILAAMRATDFVAKARASEGGRLEGIVDLNRFRDLLLEAVGSCGRSMVQPH